jgi:CubicO group peptidase (beta-lactamase class C family)
LELPQDANRSSLSGVTDFDGIWRLLDGQLAAGRFPGYVAAVRLRGETQLRAGGRTALEPGSPPVREDTLFRIASLTKPIAAVLTLGLVEEGVLALEDPVGRWLPEAASPRVLRAVDGPLDDTVPAGRPVTVLDLLRCTSGWGVVMRPGPLQAAMLARGVFGSPLVTDLPEAEFLHRLLSLPLAFQPGEGWLYHSGSDILGAVLARATGRAVSDLLAERVLGPLGMTGTTFWTKDTDRLATAYVPGEHGLDVLDRPDGRWSAPPPFEQLSGGLLGTGPDVLRFFTAMADGGAGLLSPASLARMTTDQLTDAQREQATPFLGAGSWGLNCRVEPSGRWGWTGGTGTVAWVDPARDTVAVLLTQRAMNGPGDGFEAFSAAVGEA